MNYITFDVAARGGGLGEVCVGRKTPSWSELFQSVSVF